MRRLISNLIICWQKIEMDFSTNYNHIRQKAIGGIWILANIAMIAFAIVAVPNIRSCGITNRYHVVHQQKVEMLSDIRKNPTIKAHSPKVKAKKKSDFANELAQIDEEQPKMYRLLPSIVIAQATIESSWGQSVLYQKANNAFGIKGTYHGKSIDLKTREVIHGKSVIQVAEFKKYPNLEASVRDHNKMLVENYLQDANDLNSYISIAKTLQKDHYATDPHYADNLMQYIKTNHLDRFD